MPDAWAFDAFLVLAGLGILLAGLSLFRVG